MGLGFGGGVEKQHFCTPSSAFTAGTGEMRRWLVNNGEAERALNRLFLEETPATEPAMPFGV